MWLLKSKLFTFSHWWREEGIKIAKLFHPFGAFLSQLASKELVSFSNQPAQLGSSFLLLFLVDILSLFMKVIITIRFSCLAFRQRKRVIWMWLCMPSASTYFLLDNHLAKKKSYIYCDYSVMLFLVHYNCLDSVFYFGD